MNDNIIGIGATLWQATTEKIRHFNNEIIIKDEIVSNEIKPKENTNSLFSRQRICSCKEKAEERPCDLGSWAPHTDRQHVLCCSCWRLHTTPARYQVSDLHMLNSLNRCKSLTRISFKSPDDEGKKWYTFHTYKDVHPRISATGPFKQLQPASITPLAKPRQVLWADYLIESPRDHVIYLTRDMWGLLKDIERRWACHKFWVVQWCVHGVADRIFTNCRYRRLILPEGKPWPMVASLWHVRTQNMKR